MWTQFKTGTPKHLLVIDYWHVVGKETLLLDSIEINHYSQWNLVASSVHSEIKKNQLLSSHCSACCLQGIIYIMQTLCCMC